MLFSW